MDSSCLNNYLQTLPDSTISFDYVPSRYLASSFQLKNNTRQRLAFSIKTNAPFAYLVKPRLGCLNPYDSIHVHITMLPTKYDTQTPECSDKFLINACPINTPFVLSSQAAQKANEVLKATPKNLIQQRKLTVKFKQDSNETIHDMSLETRDTSRCEESMIGRDEDMRFENLPMTNILTCIEKLSSEEEISDREMRSDKKEREGRLMEKIVEVKKVEKKECCDGIEKKLQGCFEKVKETVAKIENVSLPLDSLKVGVKSYLWIAVIIALLSFILGGIMRAH